MSYTRNEGKDKIVFISKDEYKEPAKETLVYDKDEEQQMGLIKPDGEINWNCPCLQGMADGPCGEEFKDSFSCFHHSEADQKGSDCIDQFRKMQECFMQHPDVYSPDDDKEIKEDNLNIDDKDNIEEMASLSVDENVLEEKPEIAENEVSVEEPCKEEVNEEELSKEEVSVEELSKEEVSVEELSKEEVSVEELSNKEVNESVRQENYEIDHQKEELTDNKSAS